MAVVASLIDDLVEMIMPVQGLEKFVSVGKENAEAFVKSGNAAYKGFEELSKTSQALAAKALEQSDAAVKALLAVKSPAELADLQGRLAREAVESAIADSRKLAELVGSIYTSTVEPISSRFAAFKDIVKFAA